MSSPADAFLRLRCPQCGTRLVARPAHVGKNLLCPKCSVAVQVVPPSLSPDPPENEYALRDPPHGVRAIPPEQHSGPVVSVSLAPEDLLAEPSEDASAAGPPVEEARPLSQRPKLPPWPMFTGVLAVFRDPRMLFCWVGLSIGLVLLLIGGSTAAAFLSVVSVAAPKGLELGAVAPTIFGLFLTLATVAFGLIWLVISAVYLLAVLQDSAAGNDRIANWPDSVWIDWIGESFYVFTSVIISAGLGYGASWLLGPSAAVKAACLGGGPFFLFPIILLSTLEMQSPLTPLSPVVLASIPRNWRSWALFYLQTGLLGGVVVGTVAVFAFVAGAIGSGLLFAFLLLAASAMAVLAVGAQLLYFRLLGRLTWICAEKSREEESEQAALDVEDASGETPEDDPPLHPTPLDDF